MTSSNAYRFEQGALPGDAAWFSEDGRYRYLLERGTGSPTMGCIMLNPSTADAHEDDATIRKVKGFAERWGYPRVRVVNLYGYRATDPKELRWVDDPVGARNDDALLSVIDSVDLIVAAWGADRDKRTGRRIDIVIEYIERMKKEIWCFRETSKGAPEHPLYIPYSIAPVRWKKCPLLGARN